MSLLNVPIAFVFGVAWAILMGGLSGCQLQGGAWDGDRSLKGKIPAPKYPESSSSRFDSIEPTAASPVEPEIRVDPSFKVSRPWRIVFVSKDGPKGHESYSSGACGSSVWCQIWEGAEHFGQMAGADIELAYVPHECSDNYECTTAQIHLIDQLIHRGDIDGMVIGPRESNLLVPVVEKAIAAGIPVLVTDTPLNTNQVITQVLPDDYQMGERVARWVVTDLKGKGNVLVLNGPETQANALNRKSGILAGLSTGDIRVLDIQYAEWTKQEAETITREWLTEFSDIDAIMTGGGDLALGVVTALNAQAQDDMLVTSFDVYPQIEAAIASGAIDVTVDQRLPLQGQLGVQLLLQYLEQAEPFQPIVYIPDSRLLMKDNSAEVSP